jgi:uncharacterized Zn finger protein (UPF0148 family)
METHYPELNIKDIDDEFLGFDIKHRFCKQCGEELFEAHQKIYCSEKCRTVNTRKAERPSKEDLENLIDTTPMIKIGKMFNVSDNAVRKWAKSYGINLTKEKTINKICPVCNKEFTTNRGCKEKKCCSAECRLTVLQKPLPNKKDLFEELKISTYKQMAIKYNMHETTLLNRMKKMKQESQ